MDINTNRDTDALMSQAMVQTLATILAGILNTTERYNQLNRLVQAINVEGNSQAQICNGVIKYAAECMQECREAINFLFRSFQ